MKKKGLYSHFLTNWFFFFCQSILKDDLYKYTGHFKAKANFMQLCKILFSPAFRHSCIVIWFVLHRSNYFQDQNLFVIFFHALKVIYFACVLS